MESTIIAANSNSSKTWGCRLWEHLSCIICQKGHAQQVIILLEYVVIICNLHCTAVGMFVLPSKSSHPSPARFWDISLWCSFIFGRNDEPVCCIQTMQKHTSAWVARHIWLFSFQRQKVVKDLQWALKWNLAPNDMLSVKRFENN